MTSTNIPKVILITGCSSGFGMLAAARLASQGHHVVATMRDLNKKQDLLDDVAQRGGELTLLKLDVTDNHSITETVNAVKDKFDTIDVLVNNAGYAQGGFFEDLTEKEIRDQMDTNFFGLQNVTREVIPLMRENGRGKIINISSVSGFSSSPGVGAYSASKWALEAFSESLRYELEFFNIDVLLIEPGSYKTKIFFENARPAKNSRNPESPYFNLSQHLYKRVMSFVESNRKNPEDIAILIEKLINAKNPRFRNIPDVISKIQFHCRKILPFWIYSWIVKKIFLSGYQNK